MQPTTDTDYKKLFSEIIKKQMVILGPDITLAKVKNVVGLTVDVNGEVLSIQGDPQQLLQALINQFVELSGLIVRKTMESILSQYPGMIAAVSGQTNVTSSQPIVEAVTTSPQVQSAGVSASTQSEKPPVTDQTAAPAGQTPSGDSVGASPLGGATTPPPSISDMKLDSLAVDSAPHKAEQPQQGNFTQSEMDNLNKALDDLSKQPLSTDPKPV